MYYEFIREIMLCLKVIKKDFKYGGNTPLNHNEAVLLYFVYSSAGSPYLLADILDQDPAQVYRSLKKLEEMDLVAKEKSGKKANYTLTSEGEKMVEVLKEGVREFKKHYPELYTEGEELLKRLREFREKMVPILN
ncbi:hypothetical protein PM10SUCC1_17440 [Propionigenium maris DSM 9537]|uniref:HTH marR-type domain-containing protein n=1 Tax=Propionigenium maris DSM 9537 TaxID=1123000 RepID=A0A9W6GL94_9FUSO|nr:MarR family winged helix-turn-helix transcriptional regulator [Propionigenium maris]GLI56230.1 hypothetical protein PM10SUCC1_17440 [Propionigenium maris DSM 9537]